MKSFKILALIAGAIAIPIVISTLAVRRARRKLADNVRYDINDYVADQGI